MAQSLIDILIRARRSGTDAIKQTNNDLQDLDRFAGMASKGLAGIAGAAAVSGLYELAGAMDELARRGAIFQQIGSVLGDYAASIGSSADAMVSAAKRASAGTISEFELILQANRAIQFEVAKTPEAFAKLIELSTALGRAQGIADTQALDYLVSGLSRESRLLLDNLGLIIDLDKATGTYAESIGKTADQLTSAERKQALLNAAFEQGAVALQANRDAVDSAATQYERFDANVQNLKDNLGEMLATLAAENVGGFADAIANINATIEGEGDLPNWLVEAGAGMREWGESTAGATPLTAAFTTVMQALGMAIQGTDQSTRESLAQIDTRSAAIAEMRAASEAAEAAEYNAASAIDAQGQSAAIAATNTVALADSLAKLAGSGASAIIGAAKGVVDIVGGQKAKDLAKEQVRYLQEQTLELEKQGLTGLDLTFAYEEIKNQALGVFGAIEDSDRAASRMATRTVPAIDKEFEKLKGTVGSVLSGALNPDIGVNPADFLPRADAINEDARRLGDVVVKGFDSPWASYLSERFPELFGEAFKGADIKEQAARALQDFQDGLVPQLINADQAKERVRRMIIGEQRMEELAAQIAGELSAELGNISVGDAEGLARQALGVGGGGLLEPPDSGEVANQYGGIGATAAAAFTGGVQGAIVDGDLGVRVITALDEQLRAESNLALLTEGGKISGRAWGGGFLNSVESGVPGRLIEILTALVTPGVENLLNQRTTLQGAR